MQQVREALEAHGDEPMTMGQVMDRGGIAKTAAAEVSSALHKLRNAGLIASARGPSTSPNGPRFVKMYRWAVKPVKKVVEPEPVVKNPLSGLGVFRI